LKEKSLRLQGQKTCSKDGKQQRRRAHHCGKIHSTGTKQKVRRSIHKLDAQDMGTESWIVGVLKNISPTMIFLIDSRSTGMCLSVFPQRIFIAKTRYARGVFVAL
jgi:hypothetical protein